MNTQGIAVEARAPRDLGLPARGLLLRRARGRRLGGPRRPRRHLADRAPARRRRPRRGGRWRSRSVRLRPRTRPPLAPPACSRGARRSQRAGGRCASWRRRGGCSGSGWSRSVCCWPRARSTTGARCTSRASTARRPGTAATGLAVFSLTMGFARLAGDRLATAFGSRAVVRGGLLAGACALAATAAAPSALTAIAAFGALGLGLASVYPLGDARGRGAVGRPAERRDRRGDDAGLRRVPARPAGRRAARPASSLRASLAAVGGLCVLAAWLARGVTDESSRRARSEHAWECPPHAPSSAPISS